LIDKLVVLFCVVEVGFYWR